MGGAKGGHVWLLFRGLQPNLLRSWQKQAVLAWSPKLAKRKRASSSEACSHHDKK